MSSYLYQYFQDLIEQNSSLLAEYYPGLNAQQLIFTFEDYVKLQKNVLDPEDFSNKKNIHYENLHAFLAQVKTGTPLSYISRQKAFLNLNLYVDPRVLIPRSETEVLVDDLAQKISRSRQEITACDVGTGSGCIPLGLLSEVKSPIKMTAIDISEEALSVTKLNYFKHKYHFHRKSQCEFICNDRLNGTSKGEFDLIVSNPPYIKEVKDRDEVHKNVLNHEPHIALFLKDDEYNKWFQEFFNQVLSCLKENGLFAMECSELHIDNLLALAHEVGFNKSEILKDLTGRKRFLYAYKGDPKWIN